MAIASYGHMTIWAYGNQRLVALDLELRPKGIMVGYVPRKAVAGHGTVVEGYGDKIIVATVEEFHGKGRSLGRIIEPCDLVIVLCSIKNGPGHFDVL